MATVSKEQIELANSLINGQSGAITNIFAAGTSAKTEQDNYEAFLGAAKALTDMLTMMHE